MVFLSGMVVMEWFLRWEGIDIMAGTKFGSGGAKVKVTGVGGI